MLKHRIIELVHSLPLAANIYPDSELTGANPSTVVLHRRAHALLDPAFAWHYVQTFVDLDLPLPAIACEPFFKQAYDHLVNRSLCEDLDEALIFQHSKWRTKRGLLEALLLLPGLRLDEVAVHVGCPVATVMSYEQLFWSVRDRLKDKMYLNELVYPETRHVEYLPDYFIEADPCRLMLRAAFSNDLDTVLQIFGAGKPRELLQDDSSMKQQRERILADADHVVRAGGYNQSGIPVLESARKLMLAAEKQTVPKRPFGDDVIGLTALRIDPGEAARQCIKRLNDTSDYEQLVKTQMLDSILVKKN